MNREVGDSVSVIGGNTLFIFSPSLFSNLIGRLKWANTRTQRASIVKFIGKE